MRTEQSRLKLKFCLRHQLLNRPKVAVEQQARLKNLQKRSKLIFDPNVYFSVGAMQVTTMMKTQNFRVLYLEQS